MPATGSLGRGVVRQRQRDVLITRYKFAEMDYYELLGVDKNANSAKIAAAFRKMALKYHPDKTLRNKEEAGGRFIKIRIAYECLIDEDKRRVYDNIHAFVYGGKDEDEDVDENWKKCTYMLNRTKRATLEAWVRSVQRALGEMIDRQMKLREYLRKNERKRAAAAARAQRRRDEQIEVETVRREARENEAERQEKRWRETQKCFHSSFCEKVRYRRNVKCDACCRKGSTIAFNCPYCPSSLCQKCVGEFAARRAREQKMEIAVSAG